MKKFFIIPHSEFPSSAHAWHVAAAQAIEVVVVAWPVGVAAPAVENEVDDEIVHVNVVRHECAIIRISEQRVRAHKGNRFHVEFVRSGLPLGLLENIERECGDVGQPLRVLVAAPRVVDSLHKIVVAAILAVDKERAEKAWRVRMRPFHNTKTSLH
jgi:hypothetical protein